MFDMHTTEPSSESRASANREKALANLIPFQKGKSGNPRGRPKKDLDLAAMAQKHAELAVQTLANCLTDPEANWPAKVSAASELLDRGFGRAPQSLDVEHRVGFTEQFEDFMRGLMDRPKRQIIDAEITETMTIPAASITETVNEAQ